MGPTTLFDKSFLQSISTDESVSFDHFFMPIVCPVFYVETLGDLAKAPTRRGPPEVIVRDIANKFPEWAGSPCVFHTQLAINDLLGNHVELSFQIPRPGGRPVKSGVVFEQTPEKEAFQRWHNGQLERPAAAHWRKALSELDLTAIGKLDSLQPHAGRSRRPRPSPKNWSTELTDPMPGWCSPPSFLTFPAICTRRSPSVSDVRRRYA